MSFRSIQACTERPSGFPSKRHSAVGSQCRFTGSCLKADQTMYSSIKALVWMNTKKMARWIWHISLLQISLIVSGVCKHMREFNSLIQSTSIKHSLIQVMHFTEPQVWRTISIFKTPATQLPLWVGKKLLVLHFPWPHWYLGRMCQI